MKKISYYIISFLLIGLYACSDDYNEGIAGPQTNPQEPAADINFQIGTTELTDFDFNTITGDSVVVMKSTSLPEYEDGATAVYKLELSAGEEPLGRADAPKVVVPVALSGSGEYKAATEELSDAVIELFGRRPESRTLKIRMLSYVTVNGQTAYAASNTAELHMTPIAPFIDSAYYLIGTPNGWNATDVTTLLKFEHSGKDVYEDPNFTLLFESTGDCYWKIIPQKVVDAVEAGTAENVWMDGVLGTAINNDDSPEGTLVERIGSYDPGSMLISEKGWVKITLNMLEYTYSVEVIGEMAQKLYVPGGYQGWSPSTAPVVYTQNLDMKYDGYVNIAGSGWDQGFKFVNGPDWPNADNGYRDYGVNDAGELMGGGNVIVDEEGFYRLTVDLSGSIYTYTATKTEWGIIGDATVNGWDGSTGMTLNPATSEWTVTTPLTAGTMKFRANDGWDINLGGDVNNLTYGGDNISITEAGTYVITLSLGDPAVYKATFVKQ